MKELLRKDIAELDLLELLMLDSKKSPALIASTLFGLLRQSGLSLKDIKITAEFLKSHVDIDKIVAGD